jgi:plasmid stabilization system protein ParE
MKLVYARSALRDLEAIHSYIARDNPEAVRIVAVFHTARDRRFR